MEPKNDGGPAFPVAHPESVAVNLDGMSLRAYLAGRAMQGLLSWGNLDHPEDSAKRAVLYADFLIKELQK